MGPTELAIPFDFVFAGEPAAFHVHHQDGEQQWRPLYALAAVPNAGAGTREAGASGIAGTVPQARHPRRDGIAAEAYSQCRAHAQRICGEKTEVSTAAKAASALNACLMAAS